MHIAGGIFFGERELPPVTGGVIYSYILGGTDWIANMYPWDIESLDNPAFEYKVYSGTAGDDWLSDWVIFDWDAATVKINITDNWCDMVFTHQGQFAGDTRKLVRNYLTLEAVRGFNIKNRTPGCQGKYQVIALR